MKVSVSKVLNFLLKSGASVAYQDFSEIHVSGHAAQEEQNWFFASLNQSFSPVHGEYNHINKHKETAILCGVPEKNIYLMSDGADQVELCAKYLKKIKSIKTGKVFIDNQINEQIVDDVVIDRQKLAEAGLVILPKLIKVNINSSQDQRLSAMV